MAKKYYVVWKGHEVGVFDNWDKTKELTSGYPNAQFKSFKSREEAERAFATRDTTTPDAAPPPTGHDVIIYCDGACQPNPGEAGSGLAVYRGGALAEAWYGHYRRDGTNNTAELQALTAALVTSRAEVEAGKTAQVWCDSKYSVNCVTRWADGWKSNGWARKGGPIQNLELIQRAYAIYKSIGSAVDVGYVAAHAGIEGNEVADRLSVLAIDQRVETWLPYDDVDDVAAILKLRSG